MVTSINMEGLWMYTVNHLMRNGPKKKKKAGKHLRKLLQFHLANIMKRQETAIGKSRVAHESYVQKKNQRPK